MEYKDLIYIILAVLTILSFYFNRKNDAVKDNTLVVELTASLKSVNSELARLNKNVEALTDKTNDFNREVGILDNTVKSLQRRVEELGHKVEGMERYVYGSDNTNV